MQICDANSSRCLLRLQRERAISSWASFSPDGHSPAVDEPSCQVWVWDLQSAQHRFTLQGHDQSLLGVGYAACLAYSPDGRFLAIGSHDRTARIWDAQTGNQLHVLEGHSYWLTDLAFSPDGRILATAAWTDPKVMLWDVESGKQLRWWSAHPSGLLQVQFAPDGRQLATSGKDNMVRIWDGASGRLVREWGVKGDAAPMDFSPDGRRLVAWVSKANGAGQDVPSLQLWDP